MSRKKLIEVALPLEAINKASVRESFIYRGNPSALHKWWAQRPLAAARAVIFAQMVDDPSSSPKLFPTEEAQEKERQRLFRIIEDLVLWENTTNEKVLRQARDEIWKSWRRTCAENADHPRAAELFDPEKLPVFYDPFAGGGTLPLEAQRLGLETCASDLNPVAVLINKAMVEIPPKFAGRPPVNPGAREQLDHSKGWRGVQGLAEDVLFYGKWMHEEAEKRIGHLYPKVEITREMAKQRPDLRPLAGQALTVIAWLWVRTVKSPNPAFATLDVPLATTFMLSTKAGKEVYVEPVVEDGGYRFTVKVGVPPDALAAEEGTKLGRGSNFRCLMSGKSGAPIQAEHIRREAQAGRLGVRLMATVAESDQGRVYLSPTEEMQDLGGQARAAWRPDVEFLQKALGFRIGNYGMARWSDLFTPRQLVALTTFSELVQEARERVKRDAVAAGLRDDDEPIARGGRGATAYADALAVYLAFVVSKIADYNCSLVPWYSKEDRPSHLFSKQTISMVWDFTELNPLCEIGGAFSASTKIVAEALAGCCPDGISTVVSQLDAATLPIGTKAIIVSTDPPYYDNIGYADLSDFFYVWLRHSLKPVFPDLFGTVAVPKAEELVATPARHGGEEKAEAFFLGGMSKAINHLAEQAHPAFPVTIYYAFRQAETKKKKEGATASTAWSVFLEAVLRAGFSVTGTLPMRTERGDRARGIGSNALASSIVLVCRARAADAAVATRSEFLRTLKAELPAALKQLQRGNIAPVDLAQAAIGPGMAVFSRYAKVIDASGEPVSVRDALAAINQVLDEALAEQEGDFDADTRWALAWFDQFGFSEGESGVAETLSTAKNTSIGGLTSAHLLASSRGKVRLLQPEELSDKWDPSKDPRITPWAIVHHLVRVLGSGGETGAAELVSKLGTRAESARELAYRLYTLCERKRRAPEALAYNGLVQSWPEIMRLAREAPLSPTEPQQATLFGRG